MEQQIKAINWPDSQQKLAQRTSIQDLLVMTETDCKNKIDTHQQIQFFGLVGFDPEQQQFILIPVGQNAGPHYQEDDIDKFNLSAREREVLQLVAHGDSNAQIAHKLVISRNTVKVHLRNIFDKLDVQSRTEAAMCAMQQGLISISQIIKPVTPVTI